MVEYKKKQSQAGMSKIVLWWNTVIIANVSKKLPLVVLSFLFLIGSLIGAVLTIRDNSALSEDKSTLEMARMEYVAEKDNCSGSASTGNSTVNAAGLTDCGGALAVASKLEIRSLSDIYYGLCGYSFGSAVEGCTYSATDKIYVCSPGSTVYDRRIVGVSRFFIRYQTFSYRCDDAYNTIRHELLHVVYGKLTKSQQTEVVSKLAKYRSKYSSQLSLYPYSQRDEELFVRVGADGESVDDIDLINLYAQVNKKYVSAKQNYYQKAIVAADKEITRIEQAMTRNYAILAAAIVTSTLSCIISAQSMSQYAKLAKKATRKRNLRTAKRVMTKGSYTC